MSQQFENKIIDKYKKICQPTFFKKFHGGRFQSNFPDTLFVTDDHARFIEFKVSDKLKVPWRKFRLGQHLECLKMAASGLDVKYGIYVKETGRLYFIPIFMVKEEEGVKISENLEGLCVLR